LASVLCRKQRGRNGCLPLSPRETGSPALWANSYSVVLQFQLLRIVRQQCADLRERMRQDGSAVERDRRQRRVFRCHRVGFCGCRCRPQWLRWPHHWKLQGPVRRARFRKVNRGSDGGLVSRPIVLQRQHVAEFACRLHLTQRRYGKHLGIAEHLHPQRWSLHVPQRRRYYVQNG